MTDANDLVNEAYQSVFAVRKYQAAIIGAVRVLRSSDSKEASLTALIHSLAGFDPAMSDVAKNEARNLDEWLRDLERTDFLHVRKTSLVQACAALEHLAKSVFVAAIEAGDTTTHDQIADLKFSVAVKVLSEGGARDWMFIAAEAAINSIEPKYPHFDKYRNFVKKYFQGRLMAFDGQPIDKKLFNTVFVIRNLIVHSGGLIATDYEANLLGVARGRSVELNATNTTSYLQIVEAMADALSNVSPTNLAHIL